MNKDNGYWIECVPVREPSLFAFYTGLYTAQVRDFPDIKAYGISPDRAISKLKRRLEHMHHDYTARAEPLPKPHSRLRPPQTLADTSGWMSVYVSLHMNTINDGKSVQ